MSLFEGGNDTVCLTMGVEQSQLSTGDKNELFDGPTKVVPEPSSMLTTGVDNRRPISPQGGKNTTSSFVLTGGVNASVESGGVNGGTTSLPGAKLTLANYTTQKPTSDFGKLSSTITTGVNRKSNSSPGSVTIIDSLILPMGGQMKRVENEMSSEMKAVVKKVLLKHPESQAGLRFVFDTGRP